MNLNGHNIQNIEEILLTEEATPSSSLGTGGIVYFAAQANFRQHQRLDLDELETQARRRVADAESSAKERLGRGTDMTR